MVREAYAATSAGSSAAAAAAALAAEGVETEPTLEQVFGLAGWGNHVVRLVGFDAPYPSEALEACVAPAHYGQDLKQQVRASRSHVILYYAGHEANPLDQYVALAAVAMAQRRLRHLGRRRQQRRRRQEGKKKAKR